MNIRTEHNRTLAFAGILQALQLVQRTAYGKPCDVDALQTTLHSVVMLQSDSVDAVYNGTDGIRAGLRLLQTQLLSGGGQKPDIELSRYLVVLLHLERKLSKRKDLLERLRIGIEQVQRQMQHFELEHSNVLAGLADTYTDTVSSLNPRLLINGNPARLREPATANRIRALLLAAMRSAVLWRQCGGTRLGLLLRRRKMVEIAIELLS